MTLQEAIEQIKEAAPFSDHTEAVWQALQADLYDEQGREIAAKAARQSADDPGAGLCAYVAIENLYIRCGLEPPTLAHMLKLIKPKEEGEGLSFFAIRALLSELGFPALAWYGFLPDRFTYREFLPSMLEQGFNFILAMQDNFPVSETTASQIGDRDFAGMPVAQLHAVVPFGVNQYGVKVITGLEDAPIELYSWAAYPALSLKPWRPDYYQSHTRLRGFFREFVMVDPLGK